MPRNNDPAEVTVGTGLAADESIEANALIHPTGGNEGLRVHIEDPSRAHMASAIGIVDAGGYYVSDEVEGALQEIGGGISSTHANGLLKIGTWTSFGLVLTLDAGTTVLFNGMEADYAGDTVTLTDNNTNYVYIDSTTGVLTAALAIPALNTEPVWISEVTTAAGVVTASRDARFFVFNIDRKPPLTLRAEGSAGDHNSEGAFETLDAAFFYLETYAGAAVETFRILMRGDITVAQSYDLPSGNVTIEGDGNARFLTGAALVPMFDLAGNKNITFRNLTFVCNHAGSTAISDAGGQSTALTVEKCQFIPGTQQWDTAISITGVAVPNTSHIYRDCEINAVATGVILDRPNNCLISNINVVNPTGALGAAAMLINSTGLTLAEGKTLIEGCITSGFLTSMTVAGYDMAVRSCMFNDARNGVGITGGSRITMDDCEVYLNSADSATGGQDGVAITAGTDVKIRGCRIINPRATWAASGAVTPDGISVANSVTDVSVTDCIIDGFYNTTGLLGYGINAGTSVDRLLVSDTTITTSDVGILVDNSGTDTKIQNCTIEKVRIGVTSVTTDTYISECRINLDSTVAEYGIELFGTQAVVEGCSVLNTRAYGAPFDPFGIHLSPVGASVSDVRISDCTIQGFLNTSGALPTGRSIEIKPDVNNVTIANCTLQGAATGVQGALTNVTNIKVIGCTLKGMRFGIQALGTTAAGSDTLIVDGCVFDLDESTVVIGHSGVLSVTPNTVVSNCVLTNSRGNWVGEVVDPYGIQLAGIDSQASDNRIDGFNNTNTGTGFGISLEASGGKAEGNNISKVIQGVTIVAGAEACKANDNFIEGGDVVGVGLSVVGSAASPTRDIDFSNNTVVGCTTTAIVLEGLVYDAVIDGNIVDMYLTGAPADPTADGIVAISAGAGEYPHRITISNNDVWRCNNGILALGAAGDEIEDITIEGNLVHHCGYAQAAAGAAPYASFVAAGSKGIGLELAVRPTVHGNNIRRIGLIEDNVGAENPPTAGVNVQAQGIYCRDCDDIRVTENIVSGTILRNAGEARGVYAEQATVAPVGITIEDNTVKSPVGTIGIHVSSTDLDLADLRVSGNTVGDATGPYPATGILIDTNPGGGAAEANLTNLFVCDNHVTLNLAGVAINVGIDGALTDVTASGNILHAAGGSGGLYFHMTPSVGPTYVSSNVSVTGNIIHGGLSYGCKVYIDGGMVLSDLTVSDNQIEDSSQDGLSIGGIDALTAFHDVKVTDNIFRNHPHHGVEFQGGTGTEIGICTNLSFTGNQFQLCGGVVATRSALLFQANAEVKGVTIDGNQFQECCAASDLVTLGTLEIQTVINSGFDSLTGAHISGNTFHDCGAAGIRVGNYALGSNARCVGLTITDNQVADQTNDAIHVDFSNFDLVQGTLIADNTINDIGTGAVVASDGGIVVLGPAAAIEGLSINSNVISNTSLSSIAVGGIAVDAPSHLYNLQVAGNNLLNADGTSGAIFITVVGFTRSASIRDNISRVSASHGVNLDVAGVSNLKIQGNQIQDSSANGILVTSSTHVDTVNISGNAIENPSTRGISVQVEAGSDSFTVNGNTIDTTGDSGIYLNLANSVAATYTVQGVVVNGNALYNLDKGGIVLISGDDTDWFGIVVTSNTIREWSVSGAGVVYPGIRILESGALPVNDIRAITVSNNTLYTEGADCIGIDLDFGANAVDTLTVIGNAVYFGAGLTTMSMFVEWGLNSNNISFVGNSFFGAVTGVTFAGAGTVANYGTVSANNERLAAAGVGNWATFFAAAFVGGTSDATGANIDS